VFLILVLSCCLYTVMDFILMHVIKSSLPIRCCIVSFYMILFTALDFHRPAIVMQP
jgi:hypothetical protein